MKSNNSFELVQPNRIRFFSFKIYYDRKEGMRILQEVNNITIIHDDKNTVGATGIHASGDNVRPRDLFRKIFVAVVRERGNSLSDERISSL